MKKYFYFAAIVFFATASNSKADTFYRETFNFCEINSGRPSAEAVSGWLATTTGNVVGSPSILKIQPEGAGTKLPAVSSSPEGPEDGNAFWARDDVTRGLLIATDEISFDISELTSVVWRQRIDRQHEEYLNYGARLAFLIDGTWYISDYSATQKKRGHFERRELHARSTTYGTTPHRSDVGISAPENSGIELPETGTVSAFGLFMIRAFARVRIDDFALQDQYPAGTHDIDLPPVACGSAIYAPSSLSASDGTSSDFVDVSWEAIANAVSYRLFRSQFSDIGGTRIGGAITSATYRDFSAVPGVSYFYWVVAVNEFGEQSVRSASDTGFASSTVIDDDGDGVGNEQEEEDQTDTSDPGSFQLHLASPAYTKYNTYLGQWNFLELGASGTKDVIARVTALSLSGEEIGSIAITIAAQTQFDVDVNQLIKTGCESNPLICAGFVDQDRDSVLDTYGVIKIDFNADDEGVSLTGRLSNYRFDNARGEYSFAFARELRNPTQGVTYAGANTYDPQGAGYLVPNWLEISNLDNEERVFEFFLYDQSGFLRKTEEVTVAAFGSRDVAAGHEELDAEGRVRESVYLVEIRPKSGSAKYFATVSRYSSNATPGVMGGGFNYAFTLDALSGTSAQLYAPISNTEGVCNFRTNWVEVVNVRERFVTATAVFRDASGVEVGSTSMRLPPKSQYHFNASAILPKNSTGSVEVSGDEPGGFTMQSLVYIHDCESNLLQTAYVVQGRIPGVTFQQGSVNSHIGMENTLYVLSAKPEANAIALRLATYDTTSILQTGVLNIGSHATEIHSLSSGAGLRVQSNRYGALSLEGSNPGEFSAGVLRVRPLPNGKIDFVMPTRIQ